VITAQFKKKAPNFFQRMMTIAFFGLEPSQAFLYVDDLIVIGCSEKHVLKNLLMFLKNEGNITQSYTPKNFYFLCMKSHF